MLDAELHAFLMKRPASGGPPAAYSIARALRLNAADSASLSRTPGSSGSQQKFTIVIRFKRSGLSSNQDLLCSGTTSANFFFSGFNSSDVLTVQALNSSVEVLRLTTTQKFRDTAAWYEVILAIDTTQATNTNRAKLYVNGSQVTAFSTTTYPAQNTNLTFNTSGLTHYLGRASLSASEYFDGYMADIYFIDNAQLTPSDFGEINATTGQWVPKQPSGLTFGTNGFWLSFYDNTSTTTLGRDDAGGVAGSAAGSNDWTLSNFSVTAGAGNDSVTDTPTNNFPTMDRLAVPAPGTVSDGGLKIVSGNDGYILATQGMSSGKWYCEVTITAAGAQTCHGIANGQGGNATSANYVGSDTRSWGYYQDGTTRFNAGSTAYGSSFTTGDVIGIIFDADNGRLFFSKNGTIQNSGNVSTGSGAAVTGLTSGPYFFAVGARVTTSAATHTVNFGQQAFVHTPPTGFVALCTSNLATPAIVKPPEQFDVETFTGTGATRSKTGLAFSPDLVWIKGRSGATNWAVYDSTRGVQKDTSLNVRADETTEATGLTAFNSDGYTTGALAKLNTNAATYAAWLWNEGITPGFDIVAWTGNGSNRNIAHGLGVAPHFILFKCYVSASTDPEPIAWHRSLANTEHILVASTNAKVTGATTVLNSTTPDASNIALGTSSLVNTNGDSYQAFAWTEVAGFSRFGSYVGNASADGPFIHCGFRPRFILIKNSSAAAQWLIYDTARDTYNPVSNRLRANDSVAEASGTAMDILSNGFKIRTTGTDYNDANTYIYAAFAEFPFKYANAR